MNHRSRLDISQRLIRAVSLLPALAYSMCVFAQGEGGPPPTPVRASEVVIEEVQEKRLVTGQLRPVRQSLVSAREPGIVIELPVNEGDRISKGQTLAHLDDEELRIQLDQLAADRAVAEATVDERRVDLERLEKELSRIRASLERGASNQKELDDIIGEVGVARARLNSARRSIDVINARTRLVEKQLSDMTVIAPFAGIVMAVQTELGEYLNEGAPVVELVSIGTVEVWMRVPQQHLPELVRGTHAIDVNLDAIDEAITTTSYRVLPQVDPNALTFTLIATLPNDDGHLAPGMSVTAHVPTRDRAAHKLVPKSAIEESEGGFYVYVARKEGEGFVARPARVHLVFPLQDRFAVRASDLAKGDLVITEGNERLLPGTPVRIVDPQSVLGPAAAGAARANDAPGGTSDGNAP